MTESNNDSPVILVPEGTQVFFPKKTVDLGDFPFKRLDDGKQKGVVIDAIALKNMYQKLGVMYQEGVDKEFIAGYTILLDAINTAYDEAFKC